MELSEHLVLIRYSEVRTIKNSTIPIKWSHGIVQNSEDTAKIGSVDEEEGRRRRIC